MNRFKYNLRILAAIIFIYVVLFEFILPPVKSVPKPTELADVILSLLNDYNLIGNILFSFGVLLSGIFVSGILFYLVRGIVIRSILFFRRVKGIADFFNYIPYIIFAALLFVWFGDSVLIEYIIIFSFSMMTLKLFVYKKLSSIKEEYINSARSLGITESKLFSEVYFKNLLPHFREYFSKYYFSVWSFLFVYEFVIGRGLGFTLKQLTLFLDYTGLLVFFVICSILFYLTKGIFQYLLNRIIFWNS